jgi:hypothetical protein
MRNAASLEAGMNRILGLLVNRELKPGVTRLAGPSADGRWRKG